MCVMNRVGRLVGLHGGTNEGFAYVSGGDLDGHRRRGHSRTCLSQKAVRKC